MKYFLCPRWTYTALKTNIIKVVFRQTPVRANSGVSEPYGVRESTLRHAAGLLPSRLDLEN